MELEVEKNGLMLEDDDRFSSVSNKMLGHNALSPECLMWPCYALESYAANRIIFRLS